MEAKAHRTIKDTVFDLIRQTNGSADYQTVTEVVLKHFPRSAWKESHWGHYRSQITSERGRYRDEFPEEIRANLRRGTGGPAERSKTAPRIVSEGDGGETREEKIKRIGDRILEHARLVIELAAKDDAQMRFKLNRWVYARLLQDEIREKRPVKQALWDSGVRTRQGCGREFSSIKGVELHRKDANEIYSVENCQLLCRECHQRGAEK